MALYFDAAKVTISGEATEYERSADSGLPFTSGFCPVCGTTLYLKTARHPGGIGITAGTLVGEPIGPPMRSVFEENRHDWVTLPPETARFPRGRNDK